MTKLGIFCFVQSFLYLFLSQTSVFKEQLFSAAEVSSDSILEFSCGRKSSPAIPNKILVH